MGISFTHQWVVPSVNGRLAIKRVRYAASHWRALDGLQLLCSLVVDSITSPYIETVERGSPANLISEITNRCVLDHLNLISVACKDHNALLPPCSASISPPPPRQLQVSQDQRKMEEHTDKNWGPDPAGSRECEAWPTKLEWLFEWVLIHHAGVAVGRQSWPRWKLSVMIDGCMSASEPSKSAQPWSASCRRPPSTA